MPKQKRKFTEELKVPVLSTLVVISGELNVLYVALACTGSTVFMSDSAANKKVLQTQSWENPSAT